MGKSVWESAWIYLGIAAAGMVAGYLLRVYFIEPQAVGAVCTADQVPWWCHFRLALIMGMIHGSWRWASVALVAVSLLVPGRWAPLLLLPGMFLGGVSMLMFSANQGALALVTGFLRALSLGDAADRMRPQGA